MEIVRLLPSLLWFGLALAAFLFAYKPLISRLERGDVSKVTVAAFQIEFVRSEFEKAAPQTYSTPDGFAPYADRIQRSAAKLYGARALWVDDDHPMKNYAERRALSALGISFDLAKSNAEARELMVLSRSIDSPYDLIISDISRPTKGPRPADFEVAPCFPDRDRPAEAGCRLINLTRQLYPDHSAPIIFYSEFAPRYGAPPGALGSTQKFDELAALVLDALERRRLPKHQNAANCASCAVLK